MVAIYLEVARLDVMNLTEFNSQLAHACQECHAACCRKGLLFMPKEEHAAIAAFLKSGDPQSAAEFFSRSKQYPQFWLYDQMDRCQFLDDNDHCKLHSLGLKPSECFWWPYHIYRAPDGGFEIRLSTSCCDGHKAHSDSSPYPRWIVHKSNSIGLDVIAEFRQVYRGSYESRLIGRVEALREAFISPIDLPLYRSAGEKLFPKANWDLGIKRYERLLALFPDGIWSMRIGNDIVAYMTLWPVKADFMEDFIAGRRNDDHFDESAIDLAAPEKVQAWYVTALAILSDVKELRGKMRRQMHLRLRQCLEKNSGAIAFAEIATPEGERFLRNQGFLPTTQGSHVFAVTLPALKPLP